MAKVHRTLNNGFLIHAVGASEHCVGQDTGGNDLFSALLTGLAGDDATTQSDQVIIFDMHAAAQLVTQLHRVFRSAGRGPAFEAMIDRLGAELADFYRTHHDPPPTDDQGE